jgi:hypothetical protein
MARWARGQRALERRGTGGPALLTLRLQSVALGVADYLGLA